MKAHLIIFLMATVLFAVIQVGVLLTEVKDVAGINFLVLYMIGGAIYLKIGDE